jgi:hypothetical protein
MRPRKTPYIKDRSVEDNVGKYKPMMRFTCGKRSHWSDSCPESKKINEKYMFVIL